MSVYGSLFLLLSAARGSLSDDNCTRHWSYYSIRNHFFDFFAFFLFCQSYLVLPNLCFFCLDFFDLSVLIFFYLFFASFTSCQPSPPQVVSMGGAISINHPSCGSIGREEMPCSTHAFCSSMHEAGGRTSPEVIRPQDPILSIISCSTWECGIYTTPSQHSIAGPKVVRVGEWTLRM